TISFVFVYAWRARFARVGPYLTTVAAQNFRTLRRPAAFEVCRAQASCVHTRVRSCVVRTKHDRLEQLRQRAYRIAMGCEDCNDVDRRRFSIVPPRAAA